MTKKSVFSLLKKSVNVEKNQYTNIKNCVSNAHIIKKKSWKMQNKKITSNYNINPEPLVEKYIV